MMFTRDEWFQLWSGAIGAFVAAIIGGVVALMVVWLTMVAQRRQSARSHEYRVISELIVAAQDMLDVLSDGVEALEPVRRRMSAAIVAWKIDRMDSPDLFGVLSAWPHWIMNAAELSLVSPKHAQRIEAHRELGSRVSTFISALEAWPNATKAQRAKIVEELKMPEGSFNVKSADPLPYHKRPAEEGQPWGKANASPKTLL